MKWLVGAGLAVSLALIALIIVGPQSAQTSPASATATSAARVERISVAHSPVAYNVEAVVSLSAISCGTSQQGTGFLTEVGVFTAAHVIGDSASAFISPYRQESVFGTVVSRSVDGEDVTLLDAEFGAEPLEISHVLPERGRTATIAGYPGGGPLTSVAGEMLGVGDGDIFGLQAERVIMIDAPTEEGYSGGPVLNDKGEVFGVVVAMEVGTNTALAIPIGDVELSRFAEHDCRASIG